MSRIEAVLLDLDDTLVQYRRSPGEVLRSTFDTLGLDPLFSVQEYYARYDEFAETADSMDELRSDCFAALAAENGYERQLGRTVAETFSEERDQSNVELLPAVEGVLDTLSRSTSWRSSRTARRTHNSRRPRLSASTGGSTPRSSRATTSRRNPTRSPSSGR